MSVATYPPDFVRTCVGRLPGALASGGCAEVVFSNDRLVGRYVAQRYALAICQALPSRPHLEAEVLLAASNWTSDGLVAAADPLWTVRWVDEPTSAGLKRTLRLARDQAAALEGDGPLSPAETDTVAAIAAQVAGTVERVRNRHGIAAAQAVLNLIEREIAETLVAPRPERDALLQTAAELTAAIDDIDEAVVAGRMPRFSPATLLGPIRKLAAAATGRRLIGGGPVAARLRKDRRDDFRRRWEWAGEISGDAGGLLAAEAAARIGLALVGDEAGTGALWMLRERLADDLGQFAALGAAFAAERLEPPAVTPSLTVEVLGRLDEPLSDAPAEGQPRTLADLYADVLDHAGAGTAEACAALENHATALRIKGRPVFPAGFARIPLSELTAALGEWIVDFLGAQPAGQPSALERLREIDLTHPALSDRVGEAVRIAVRRAAPAVENDPVAAVIGPRGDAEPVSPVVNCLLLGHPEVRRHLRRVVASCGWRLSSAAHSDAEASPFDLADRHRLTLVSFAHRVVAGTNREVQAAAHSRAILEGAGEEAATALLGGDSGETRLVSHRSSDRAGDAEQTFQTLLAVGAIVPVRDTEPDDTDADTDATDDATEATDDEPEITELSRFVFAEPEPTLAMLFSRRSVRRRHLTADDVARIWERHRSAIRLMHPARAWDRIAEQADGASAASLCRLLVAHNVLVEQGGTYRMHGGSIPQRIVRRLVAAGLVDLTIGEAIGLDRSHFVAALRRNDWLFSVATFRLLDAVAQRRVSPTQLPPTAKATLDRVVG